MFQIEISVISSHILVYPISIKHTSHILVILIFFFSFFPNQLSKSSWLYFWNNFYTNSFLAISTLIWYLFLPILYTTENLLFYLFPVLSFL